MSKAFCVLTLALSVVCLPVFTHSGGFAPADPPTRSLAARFDAPLRSRGLARVRSLAAQAGAAAPPTLTLSIKGSPVYAKPGPVPLQTALLIVTPVWEDVNEVTQAGGKEASGQPLFLSDLTVVLANRALDCASVFTGRQPVAEADFLVVAGKVEAYLPSKGWQTTAVGKVFMAEADAAPTTSAVTLALDRFSVDVQSAAPKKKFSKDNLRGNDGRLVLEQSAGSWRVDLAARMGDVVAEGVVPLTACPIVSRKKAAAPPLLGERRLLEAARSF